MKELPEQELLSAYLDGELTVAEQARVEQFLADNPAARRTLDELRSVSLAVQDLPELRLGEDLTDRVLRDAERAILSGSADAAEGLPAERSSEPRTPHWRNMLRRVAASRGLAWSAAALAIALLIMLSSPPEPQHGGDLARAPEAATDEAAPPSNRPGLSNERKEPVDAELWAADADRGERDEAFRRDAAVEEKEHVARRMRGLEEEPEDLGFDEVAAMSAPAEGGMAAPADDAMAPDEPPAAPAAPAASAPEAEASRIAPATPIEARGGSEATADLAGPGWERGQDRPDSAAAADRLEAEGEEASADEERAAGLPVLLVHCDITPEAARQGVLDQVLKDQRIAVQDGRQEGRRTEPAARSSGLARELDPRKPATEEDAERDGAKALDDADGAFDVVYVEATPEQVADTLDQLARLPDQFLAMSVQPAPGVPSQRKLKRFNRAASARAAQSLQEEKQRLSSVAAAPADDKPKAELDTDAMEMPEEPAVAPVPDQPRQEAAGEAADPVGQTGRMQSMRNGGGGYGGGRAPGGPASGGLPAPLAAPLDEPAAKLADRNQEAADDGQAMPGAVAKAGPVEQYRVVFVLRVVPPALMAEPAAAASAELQPTAEAAQPTETPAAEAPHDGEGGP